MKALLLLLSIVLFDACQRCDGYGWLLTNRFIPFIGTICAPETCPNCRGCKTMTVPPNRPEMEGDAI